MERNTGYIISSPLVLSVPADLRRKVTKIIAAKCALSARIDASQSSPSGKKHDLCGHRVYSYVVY